MDALPQYSQVGIPAECIEKISEYVNSWELAALPCGKYVIDGERIYVSIQEYETKSYGDCRFETHKRYADIQCILQGSTRRRTGHTPSGRGTQALCPVGRCW